MQENFRVRTDLALEARESFAGSQVEIHGVTVEEEYDEEREIRTTKVCIVTENGAKAMGKPMGTYITLEAPNMDVPDEDYHREISTELARHVRALAPDQEEQAVLIVGLGNKDVTPDALGPEVIGNLKITRHVIKEYGKLALGSEKAHPISALVPGVMAQTGMETMEIIHGVVRETRPDLVIVIDALAARSTRRLNHTIQITDTGINPGSGVGNHRSALNESSIGVPVIAIGVPTVVDAATIIYDAVGERDAIAPHLNGMFVTPKDIDETIKRLSFTISEGLNMAFQTA